MKILFLDKSNFESSNWIVTELKKDFPDVEFEVPELPMIPDEAYKFIKENYWWRNEDIGMVIGYSSESEYALSIPEAKHFLIDPVLAVNESYVHKEITPLIQEILFTDITYGSWELTSISHSRVRKLMVCSKLDLEKMLLDKNNINAAVISFHDYGDEGLDEVYTSKVKKCLEISVDDLAEYELSENNLTYETYLSEAREIARFVEDILNDDCDIICQCSYGQSRSAGCAAAILETLEHRGIEIFADFRYCPSQLVYNKVHDALASK